MRRILSLIILLVLLLLPSVSLADTRALLVACSDFVTQPDLGSEISGNLQMIASALLGISPRIAGLSIEDGTIGSPDALSASMNDAFGDAREGDLSILYLCTHGVLSSSDDGLSYLLLGDGEAESSLSGGQLFSMLSAFSGEKLLILDACFSGAIIGRNAYCSPAIPHSVHVHPAPNQALEQPFLHDPSIHVLTSASGHESSWYYDSRQLATGAISYFASALSTGLGLYGSPEADLNGDGDIALAELHHYLTVSVPSSSAQLLSSDPQLILPSVKKAMLKRPLTGFSYGVSLLSADEPTFDFSFTVTSKTSVQYRLIDFDKGEWDWENAKTFLDTGDEHGSSQLSPGRKARTLTLTDVSPQDGGYLMLQVFSLQDEKLQLCFEHLIAVQPVKTDAQLSIYCSDTFSPDQAELCIGIVSGVPAEITVSILDEQGMLIRRLCQSQLTRPNPGDIQPIFWDGRSAEGNTVPPGCYTITAEAIVAGTRHKAMADITIE